MTDQEKESFAEAVYDIVCLIPAGRATSYGAIARAAGYARLSRMVGRIMAQCDASARQIPAHRVVNSQGELSGREAFGGGPGRMQELLEAEGVEVSNNRIKGWKNIFWDPLKEIY